MVPGIVSQSFNSFTGAYVTPLSLPSKQISPWGFVVAVIESGTDNDPESSTVTMPNSTYFAQTSSSGTVGLIQIVALSILVTDNPLPNVWPTMALLEFMMVSCWEHAVLLVVRLPDPSSLDKGTTLPMVVSAKFSSLFAHLALA